MFSSLVSIGQKFLAEHFNNIRKDAGSFSIDEMNIAYDDHNRISTIEHVDLGITLTYTYNNKNQVSQITNGTDTWDLTYNSSRQLTKILKQ